MMLRQSLKIDHDLKNHLLCLTNIWGSTLWKRKTPPHDITGWNSVFPSLKKETEFGQSQLCIIQAL